MAYQRKPGARQCRAQLVREWAWGILGLPLQLPPQQLREMTGGFYRSSDSLRLLSSDFFPLLLKRRGEANKIKSWSKAMKQSSTYFVMPLLRPTNPHRAHQCIHWKTLYGADIELRYFLQGNLLVMWGMEEKATIDCELFYSPNPQAEALIANVPGLWREV